MQQVKESVILSNGPEQLPGQTALFPNQHRIKNFASVFTGIGGFDLPAKERGWNILFQCEKDEFANKVLNKNFPDVTRISTIESLQVSSLKGQLDLLCSGLPCQPFSQLGKQEGINDERYLWGENMRIIREARPRYIIIENVFALTYNEAFKQMRRDLEGEGYTVWRIVLPASAADADHIRTRVFFLAHPSSYRLSESDFKAWTNSIAPCEASEERQHLELTTDGSGNVEIRGLLSSEILREIDGVPNWMDRIKALGNAVYVPLIRKIYDILEWFDAMKVIQSETTVKARKKVNNRAGTVQPVTTVTNLKRNRKVTKQGRAGYTGNKYAAECYKKIINELPPHRNFISGFLGNCAVLREKLPAKENNIGIEVDRKVINQYWRQSVTKTVVHNLNFIDHIVHELLAMDDEAQGLILSLKDKRNTLFYLDPPYLLSSRASGKTYYLNELTDKDHTDLLTWCNRQSCMIAISHYPCELYDTMLTGPKWRKITYQVRTRKEVVTEALYMNYPAPKELHEYTWLGNDSWNRQRVKRKLSRIAAKLMELPAVERNAIISHIKNL